MRVLPHQHAFIRDKIHNKTHSQTTVQCSVYKSRRALCGSNYINKRMKIFIIGRAILQYSHIFRVVSISIANICDIWNISPKFKFDGRTSISTVWKNSEKRSLFLQINKMVRMYVLVINKVVLPLYRDLKIHFLLPKINLSSHV